LHVCALTVVPLARLQNWPSAFGATPDVTVCGIDDDCQTQFTVSPTLIVIVIGENVNVPLGPTMTVAAAGDGAGVGVGGIDDGVTVFSLPPQADRENAASNETASKFLMNSPPSRDIRMQFDVQMAGAVSVRTQPLTYRREPAPAVVDQFREGRWD
jgi:hypothetical protein